MIFYFNIQEKIVNEIKLTKNKTWSEHFQNPMKKGRKIQN